MCLNGGTCINVPDHRNYTCACSSLFTGEHCDFFAHSRASIFPIFSRGSVSARSTLSPASASSEPSTPPPDPESIDLDSKELKDLSSFYNISTSVSLSTSSSLPSSTEESLSAKEKTQYKIEVVNTEGNESELSTEKVQTDDVDSEGRLQLAPVQLSADFRPLDERRRKYIKRKYQDKATHSKQSPNTSEKVYPSPRFDEKAEDSFFHKRVTIEQNLSNKPKLLKSQTPILVLELSEPTIDFNGNQNDEDTITNTDAHSPQANQIRGKNRFLRHHEAVLSFASDEGAGQQASFFPLRKVRLVTQDKPPHPSRLQTNAFFLREKVFDSLPQESSQDKDFLADTYTPDYSQLAPQTRINRRTGVPPSPVNSLPSISSLERFSPHEDHELAEASSANERTGKVVKKESPKSYYEEHYNGRVHIGDVTEVDKHAPLQAIMDAYIELKKLKT